MSQTTAHIYINICVFIFIYICKYIHTYVADNCAHVACVFRMCVSHVSVSVSVLVSVCVCLGVCLCLCASLIACVHAFSSMWFSLAVWRLALWGGSGH